MKRTLKIIGGILGFIIVLIVAVGIVIVLVVDKGFIEEQMRSALNRHVTIEEIDVGLLSAVSGIEVRNVKVSNFKTASQLEALKDKPVSGRDVFVSLKSFTFKLQFLPILRKRFVLNELVLYEPVINVVKSKKGTLNVDDLLKTEPMTEAEKKELKKKQQEEQKKKAGATESRPLTADDIPVAVSIGKIGLEKGRLVYLDQTYNQKFAVYDLDALVSAIDIDPSSLKENNSLSLDLDFGIKTVGQITSGSVKSFDIGFSTKSTVKPFDVKTRKLDPEAAIRVGMPYGSLTGLQIFEKMKEIEALTKYIGKVSFLKDTVAWKDAFVEAWYKSGTVKLKDGTMKTGDFDLAYTGKTNIFNKNTEATLNILLADKYNEQIRSGIEKNVKRVIKGKLSKIVKPSMVVKEAMKPLVNKDGKVYLGYAVTGKLNDPKTRLVHPRLPSLESIARKSAGSAGDVLKARAEEEANKAVDAAKQKAADEARKAEKKVEEAAKKETTNQVKSLKKKFKF